jgi:hypothetical protein
MWWLVLSAIGLVFLGLWARLIKRRPLEAARAERERSLEWLEAIAAIPVTGVWGAVICGVLGATAIVLLGVVVLSFVLSALCVLL